MKAITSRRYGGPEVLKLEELEIPIPRKGEVLLRVQAAAVNPVDWHFMRGTPFPMRFTLGLLRLKNIRIGLDVAGVVESVGEGVRLFRPGDKVFGECHFTNAGSFGEYLCVQEENIIHKPSNLSFEEAAAVPLAALTAYQAFKIAGIKKGSRVLVNGASGGVGTFAVQIAKALGAHVTGVCSTGKIQQTKGLGADSVIDYSKTDFVTAGKEYDIILCNVGNRVPSEYRRALSEGGHCVIIGYTSVRKIIAHRLFGGTRSGRTVTSVLEHMDTEDLTVLRTLIEEGKLQPVIDRTYPLEKTAEAIAYVEEGHAKGKVVIKVGADSA